MVVVEKVMMGLYHVWPPADLFLLAKYYSVMESPVGEGGERLGDQRTPTHATSL